MTVKILNLKEKEEILKKLRERFGIEKIKGEIIKIGEERLFLYTGDLNYNKIKEIEKSVIIERIGVYFAKEIGNEIRLSIEGTNIFKDQIKKNIFELNENEKNSWLKGEDLQIKANKKGFLAIKYKEDFLGCGKASEDKIGNFIPKSRRIKRKE